MLATSMTMEEILCGIESIKQAMLERVQLKLNQFGFVVCNANADVPRHEYSSYLY